MSSIETLANADTAPDLGTPSEDQDRRKGRVGRLAILVVALVLIVLTLGTHIIFSSTRNEPQPVYLSILRIGLLVLGVGLVVRYCWLVARLDYKRYPTGPWRQPTSDLVSAAIEFGNAVDNSLLNGRIDRVAAYDFARRFLSSSATRSRVAETITLNGDHVMRSSTIEFRPEIANGTEGPVLIFSSNRSSALRYIPILRFNKGHLVGNLSITSASGEKLTTLAHSEYLILVGVCVSALLAAAVDRTSLSSDPAFLKKYTEVETILHSKCIAKGIPEAADVEKMSVDLLTFLKEQFTLVSPDDARLLCNFVARAHAAYAIVISAEIPREQHALFQYSYSEKLVTVVTPKAEKIRDRLKKQNIVDRLRDNTRDLLGLDPVVLNIDASRTKKCSSYHLRVSAPPGYYIAETWFHNHKTGQPISVVAPKEIYQESRPYFRCPKPRGQSYAHLYTRNFAKSGVEQPMLLVKFFERLPGSLGKAWLLALAVLAIVWIFGATWVPRAAPNPQTGALGGIDPGALIFAAPLALWALIGFSERTREYASTLTSQLNTLASMLISFSALILTLFITSGRIRGDMRWPSVALVTHPFWIILLIIAVANCWWIGQIFLIRFWSWRRVLPAKTATQISHPDTLTDGRPSTI